MILSFLKGQKHMEFFLVITPGIPASQGYPSCSSGLMRHPEPQMWKNDKVEIVL